MKKVFLMLCVVAAVGSLLFAAGAAEKPKAGDEGLSGKLVIYPCS